MMRNSRNGTRKRDFESTWSSHALALLNVRDLIPSGSLFLIFKLFSFHRKAATSASSVFVISFQLDISTRCCSPKLICCYDDNFFFFILFSFSDTPEKTLILRGSIKKWIEEWVNKWNGWKSFGSWKLSIVEFSVLNEKKISFDFISFLLWISSLSVVVVVLFVCSVVGGRIIFGISECLHWKLSKVDGAVCDIFEKVLAISWRENRDNFKFPCLFILNDWRTKSHYKIA